MTLDEILTSRVVREFNLLHIMVQQFYAPQPTLKEHIPKQ